MKIAALKKDDVAFKKAIILSLTFHLSLFFLILLSPYFPKSSRKPIIHYVSVISFPQGGGSGKKENFAETAIPQRENLRDLTTPQKLKQEIPPSLRHPAEKPKKERPARKKKKAVIQKKEEITKSRTSAQEAGKKMGKGQRAGSGLRIGIGSGPAGGTGFQSPYSSQIGLSSFPFTYYLQIIIDKVSSNWFTSLVEPGIRGHFQATVYFKIYKSGHISDLKIEESSGIKSLDLSALRAIQTSAPFPPLPKEYSEQYLGIHLIFEHTK